MKASKFNNFFEFESKKIGFNAYTTEYVVLEIELYNLLEAAMRENAIDDIAEIHPAFFDFMVDKGFIIDDYVDEIAKVKKLVETIDSDESLYQLHINPTMNCNFKCWYCYETHIKDSKMSADTINSITSYTQNVMNTKLGLKEFLVSWFGGEPLLYFDKVLMPLLKTIAKQAEDKNIKFTCGITTNGLLVNERVINASKEYGLNFYQITLDGNREQHDLVRFIKEGIGSYDKIIKNIKLLAEHKITVAIRINVSDKTLLGLADIMNDFSDVLENNRSYISFDFHKVWQVENDLDADITRFRNIFRNAGFNVSYGDIDSVRNSCYGDKINQATINYNGDVFKCTARDFVGDKREGILDTSGKIVWNEKFDERMNIKFHNRPCLNCSIMPICNGGCSQQALEHKGVDYCVYDFDERKKRDVVLNRFLSSTVA